MVRSISSIRGHYGAVLLALSFYLVYPHMALSQWVHTNGPMWEYGDWAEVDALGASDSALFVEINGLVYRSTNMGSNWANAENGLDNNSVAGFAADSDRVFAATDSGVYLSTNNGTSWTHSDTGLSPLDVSAITASHGLVLAAAAGGVYRSTDGGMNWSPSSNGLPDSPITAVVSLRGRIFAGTERGLYISTDSGQNWSKAGNAVADTNVVAIAAKDSEVFVSAGGYMYGSTDVGATWNSRNKFFDVGITNIAVTPNRIIATLGISDGGTAYVSTDRGNTWTVTTSMGKYGQATKFLVVGQNVFAGMYGGGLILSTDGGATWAQIDSGLAISTVKAIAVSADTILTPYYLSVDGGTSWIPADSDRDCEVASLALKGRLAFAVGLCPVPAGATYSGGAIFRSTDGGIHWTKQDSDLAYYPNGGSIVFMGGEIFASTGGGVYVSSDTGTSWTSANNGLFSQNVGGSADIFPPIVTCLAVSDSDIFAGTYGSGVFRSADHGASWTPANKGVPLMIDTMVTGIATCGSNVFAGVLNAGVYLSTDNGMTWQSTGGVLPEIAAGLKQVRSFAVGDTGVFAACTQYGVFGYRKVSHSWVSINAGLLLDGTRAGVSALAASDSALYAGTIGSGVWRRRLADAMATRVNAISSEPPSGFRIWQNYPNPFNPTTVIRFRLPSDSHVLVRIYNILGQVVATLVDAKESPGVHEVNFNGSDFASGVYFCRLEAGNNVMTKKMLLMK